MPFSLSGRKEGIHSERLQKWCSMMQPLPGRKTPHYETRQEILVKQTDGDILEIPTPHQILWKVKKARGGDNTPNSI